MLLAALELGHDVRVGDVRAGHADHVDEALLDRPAGGRQVGDARRLEHRQAGGAPDAAGEVQECAVAVPHVGDGVGDVGIGAERARDDVEEVDQPAGRPGCARSPRTPSGSRPCAHVLVAGDPDADDEVRTDRLADRAEHLEREPAAVLHAAAIGVGAPVDGGREELVDQMAPGDHLDPVQPAFLAAPRPGGIALQHALDLVQLDRLGERAVLPLAHRARRQRRQPVGDVVAGAPPHMRDLAHQRAVVPMDGVGQLLEPGDDRVAGGVDLAERRRAVRSGRGRAAEHGQRQPALGLFLVVEAVALLRLAVLDIGRRVRRAHHPVLEAQTLELERLEDGIGGHGRHPCGNGTAARVVEHGVGFLPRATCGPQVSDPGGASSSSSNKIRSAAPSRSSILPAAHRPQETGQPEQAQEQSDRDQVEQAGHGTSAATRRLSPGEAQRVEHDHDRAAGHRQRRDQRRDVSPESRTAPPGYCS